MQAMMRAPRGLLHVRQEEKMIVRAGARAIGASMRPDDTVKAMQRHQTSRAAISTSAAGAGEGARHGGAIRQLTTGSRNSLSRPSPARICGRGCAQITAATTPRHACQLLNRGVAVPLQRGNSSLTAARATVMLRGASFSEGVREAPRPSAAARRGLSSSTMSEREFHLLADEALEEIHDAVEEALEDGFDEEFDCNMSQGVLNILVGDRGTWVLNKQAPNRQIWWSSPVSGPMRFEFHDDTKRWLNTRDGTTELRAILAAEMSEKCGVSLQ